VLTLQQLVKRERERLGLSLADVASRSDGLLSRSTVHAIEQGRRTTVGDETLRGLAAGLSLPLANVQSAAGVGGSDTDEVFVLPRRAQRLTRKERDHVLELVDLLLERRRR
jgi:transcriptional regulator with XRE-family HTH domain